MNFYLGHSLKYTLRGSGILGVARSVDLVYAFA